MVVEKKKQRKIVKKKKVKLSKVQSSMGVSSTVPTKAQSAQNESKIITIKSKHCTQQTFHCQLFYMSQMHKTKRSLALFRMKTRLSCFNVKTKLL